jgi:hypothetical protein
VVEEDLHLTARALVAFRELCSERRLQSSASACCPLLADEARQASFGVIVSTRASQGVGDVLETTFAGVPAVRLANGALELVVLLRGSTMASVVLASDPTRLSPLWAPPWTSGDEVGAGERGHFVCVDGFGPPSSEEKAAGLPMHGEAHRQVYAVRRKTSESRTITVSLEATLPLAQERFTRTFQLVEGENVVYVESDLQNLLGVDRQVAWAEHATIGPPFLERGQTAVDLSAQRSLTRSDGPQRARRRLAVNREFTWPHAPAAREGGSPVDLRVTGAEFSVDETTSLAEPSRDVAFVTAVHPMKRLLLGYLFRPAEYPWIQNWENYPADEPRMARGLEFATQPFDEPRREAFAKDGVFGARTYRWLGARSTLTTRFLLFWIRTPEPYTRVKDVRLHNGLITVHASEGTLNIPAALGLERIAGPPASWGRRLRGLLRL